MFRASLFIICVLFSLNSVIAEEYVSHGAICHAITPDQAALMEWREQGLVSRDFGRSLWSICPLTRRAGLEPRQVSVRLYNGENGGKSVQCVLREIKNADQIQGSSQTVNLPSRTTKTVSWDMTPTDAESVMNIACALPAGTFIDAVVSKHSSTCSTAAMAGRWFAAVAYPNVGRAAIFMDIDRGGNVSGTAYDNLGTWDVSGRIDIRSSCNLSYLQISAGDVTYYGIGAGKLSGNRNVLSATAEDNFGGYHAISLFRYGM